MLLIKDMQKIHDVSLTVSDELPKWPGDREPHFERMLRLENGDIANVTYLNMNVHTGTHVDAPLHFLETGQSVVHLPLDILIGPALVIEILEEGVLTKAALQKAQFPEGTERLLVKTRNSEKWVRGESEFDTNYVALSADGAEYLVKRGVKLIGVDYLSIASFDALIPVHKTLLGAEVVIIEALNLSEVGPGEYTLYCLPLKIADSDGAPARAVLIES